MKGLVSGNIFLPRIQLMVGGIAYVTPKATTLADTIALKALDEPKKIHPKTITHAVVHIKAYSGTSRPVWTFAKIRLRGKPLSRAKA